MLLSISNVHTGEPIHVTSVEHVQLSSGEIPSPPVSTPPSPVSTPPPRGGTVTWPMNNKKSIGNHRRRRR